MKKILTLLLLTGLAFGSFAQHEDAVKFSETITIDELRDNLTILASDAMEGRETGERGQKMAAAFIAHHFEQIGLEPVVKVGDTYSYYQKFDLEKSYPGEIYVTLDGDRKNNGEDLIYWGRKNMANEETPGYKARHLPFRETLASVARGEGLLSQAVTHPRHLGVSSEESRVFQLTIKQDAGAGLDDNTVNLEKEMTLMAENTLLYMAANQFLGGRFEGWKAAIEGGGR
jgi:flagellar basal-body rod protein FlgB